MLPSTTTTFDNAIGPISRHHLHPTVQNLSNVGHTPVLGVAGVASTESGVIGALSNLKHQSHGGGELEGKPSDSKCVLLCTTQCQSQPIIGCRVGGVLWLEWMATQPQQVRLLT